MGLRITDKKELTKLLKAGKLRGQSKEVATHYLKNPSAKAKRNELNYCLIPPSEPESILYRAIIKRFGRFHEGGEAVCQLQLPQTQRRWSLDIALPRYRCGIEMDGWQFHGKYLSGFQRDRAKQLDFARLGWILIRVSNKQVREDLAGVISAIEECTRRLNRIERVNIKSTGFGRYECSTNPGE